MEGSEESNLLFGIIIKSKQFRCTILSWTFYLNREGLFQKDIKKAISYFIKSVHNQNHDFQLFECIYNHLYQQNIEKAISSYKEASNFNVYEAKNNLGVLYMIKAEEEKTFSKISFYLGLALGFFEEAVNSGNDLAIINTALIYSFNVLGIGNLRKGKKYYTLFLHKRNIDMKYMMIPNLF